MSLHRKEYRRRGKYVEANFGFGHLMVKAVTDPHIELAPGYMEIVILLPFLSFYV